MLEGYTYFLDEWKVSGGPHLDVAVADDEFVIYK
jgi:hypothetical protein